MQPASGAARGRTDAALLLGIDLGTTGAKALVVDARTGDPVATGYCAYESRTDADGRHEQDPEQWWAACRRAVREAVGDRLAERVVAVGLSGHMHALVLVDADDRYVRPAMTWADRRSATEVARLRRQGVRFEQQCANPVVEAFTAPKLAWLARHEGRSLSRAVRIVLPKDTLRHRLTGTWGTDTSDARGTLLYDVHENAWDPELWALCGGDRDLAPAVSPSTAIVGSVTARAAEEVGLVEGTPVVAGAGDVACSALGAGLVGTSGAAYVNAGTAAQVLTAIDHPVPGSHFVFGRAESAAFLAMASVYAAGLSVDWAARTLLGRPSAQDGGGGRAMDELARTEEPGARGMVFVPHLLGTSVPTHDPQMRGALLGLGVDQGSATVARAVIEGVAYACAAAVESLARLGEDVAEVRIGGGMSRSSVWAETLAAAVGVPVRRLAVDPSPLGAAMLAGLGTGVWADAEQAASACVRLEQTPPVDPARRTAYQEARRRYDRSMEALTAITSPAAGRPAVEQADPLEPADRGSIR
jgi:xylulokinase